MTTPLAIVTAASRGIGRACAEALARDGFNLVICSRNKGEIDRIGATLVKKFRRKVVAVAADVGRKPDLERLVRAALTRFRRIDVLVNNCGGPPPGGIDQLTDQQWNAGFEEVVMSVVRLSRLVIPQMRKQGGGRIITITSLTAHEPHPPLLISSTLRPGLSGFARYLARELAKDNILINNVLPGATATERQLELGKIRQKKEGISPEAYARTLPMRRLAHPEEIGNVVAFLASPAASYITGCDIPVEGGLLKGI